MVWPCLTGLGSGASHRDNLIAPFLLGQNRPRDITMTIMHFSLDCVGDWESHEGERENQTPK